MCAKRSYDTLGVALSEAAKAKASHLARKAPKFVSAVYVCNECDAWHATSDNGKAAGNVAFLSRQGIAVKFDRGNETYVRRAVVALTR